MTPRWIGSIDLLFEGEFANNLPDYQKIEIMMFILAKFPQFGCEEFG